MPYFIVSLESAKENCGSIIKEMQSCTIRQKLNASLKFNDFLIHESNSFNQRKASI